jgi:predicted acetyltransferase
VPELVSPTTALMASYLTAMAEFRAEGRGDADDHSSIGGELRVRSSVWHTPEVFASFVADLLADADPDHPRPAGWVACTTLWWAHEDEFLGRIAVRHELTDGLRIFGGHIGYDVRPTARRVGHATSMLRAVLPRARSLGVTPSALLTCDTANLASRKVIEANGGILAEEDDDIRRYWVPTG